MRYTIAFFGNNGVKFNSVFHSQNINKLSSQAFIYPTVINEENIEHHLDELSDVDFIFCTWGMFKIHDWQIEKLENLKAVFYAAGSPHLFIDSFTSADIPVYDAISANAIPVAQYCLAHTLLAMKGFYLNTRDYKSPAQFNDFPLDVPGIYSEKVALIGAGSISSYFSDLLIQFGFDVISVNSRANLRKVSLEEAFASAFVISNHLPNRLDNIGILDKTLFTLMRHGAVFINTGRGLQVNESDLLEVLLSRPDLTAVLDVTKPEPPVEDSPLYSLPNVVLTSHIAGSIGNETQRLFDSVYDYFIQYIARQY